MEIDSLTNTQAFLEDFLAKGGTEEEAKSVISHLTELAVLMYRKGDIKTIQHPDKMELACQLKKGSRRITLNE